MSEYTHTHTHTHAHIYALRQTRLAIYCLLNVTGLVKLTALEWYNGLNGYVEPNCPCLAVVFDNGRAQLMRHELDDSELVQSNTCVTH